MLAPEVAAAANDDEPVSMKPSAAEAEHGWTEEILAGFCRMVSNHDERGQTLDIAFARTWLLAGSLQDALRWWVKCGHKLKPKIPTGFGLYQSDFAKWIGGAKQPELSFFEQTALDQFRHKYGLITAAEREAEAERQRQEAAEEAKRRREAEDQRREREGRLASYQTMTGEQIRAELDRLSGLLDVVRDQKRELLILADVETLKNLSAYQEYLKTPAVRRLPI
ncbi:MAG TPA: hypothetical protein VF758_01650, partial [Candidatus Acidoferrum sp.]